MMGLNIMDNLHYKTYKDLILDIKANIHKLPPVDLIVGVPRSGMVPAYMIGLALSKPVCSINEFLDESFTKTVKATFRVKLDAEIKNVLIIDDSVNSGRAMEKIRDAVNAGAADTKYNIKYGAVYYKPGVENLVDVALCAVPQPRMFQWNYLNHVNLQNAALDIDGVLCIDPAPEQNDDGEKYIDFILNARPLYIPQYKVAALVTSRLGKYRKETEEWLKRNGVKYDKLYMLENKTAEERRKEGLHASHKAKIYKSLRHTNIFVESEPAQARKIADLSGKICFCSTTDELFKPAKPNKKSRPKFYTLRRIAASVVPVKKWRRKIRGH